jgi:hypothetical protein
MKHIKPLILEKSDDFLPAIPDKNADTSGAGADTPSPKDTSDDQLTVYKVSAREPKGTIKALIEYIGEIGNEGHKFKIVVDPNSKESRKEFHWHGDEEDMLKGVEIESEPKKKKKKESAEEVPTDKEDVAKPAESAAPTETSATEEQPAAEPTEPDTKKG